MMRTATPIAIVFTIFAVWAVSGDPDTASAASGSSENTCSLTESDGDLNSNVVGQCLDAVAPTRNNCSPISLDPERQDPLPGTLPNISYIDGCVPEVAGAQIVAQDTASDATAALSNPVGSALQQEESARQATEDNAADVGRAGQASPLVQVRGGIVYTDSSGDGLSPGIPGSGVRRVDNSGTPGPYVDDPCRNLENSAGCVTTSSYRTDEAGNEIVTEFEFINKGEIPIPPEALLMQPGDISASTALAGNPRVTNITCYSAEASARTKFIARFAGRVVNSYTLVRLAYGLDYCGNRDRGYFTFRKKKYLHQEVNGYQFFGYQFGPDNPLSRPRGGGPDGEFTTQTDTALVYAPFWDTQIRCTWGNRNGTENAHLGAQLFGGSATWRSDYGAPPTEIKYRRTQ